jgi:hypothetical protein
MNIDELAKKWRRLDPIPFEEISTARDMAHEAIQFIASAGISFAQKKEDDSHTNCEWSRSLKAFVGNLLGEKKQICLGLNIAEFKLFLLKENWTIIEEFDLKNKNLDDLVIWLKNNFESFGLDFDQFTLDKHYEIPAKTISEGGKFLVENEQSFQELSDYFSNAEIVFLSYINELTNATPVRCWPHHFDIATLLNIGNEKLQSIGIGFSPGDNSNPEPYFYVTMWPYPDANKVKFTELPAGTWNKEGWVGASLTASEIIKNQDEKAQCEMVLEFIDKSVIAIKDTLQ